MNTLPEEVARWMRSSAVVRRGGRILVAVSGGVDSMVLLHVLHAWAPADEATLVCAHLNHGLRGRSSDADERFVREQCRRLHVSCAVGHRDVKSFAKRRGLSIEMAARDLRHRFLAQTARRRSCGVIACAHHADDQAELVIMRLLRGSGSEGLGGMKVDGVSPADANLPLIRPLLGVRRGGILEFARLHRIPFREDSSNASRRFLRNRIRHELLPFIRSGYQPSIDAVLTRTASLLSAEADCIRTLAADWLRSGGARFDSLPLAVRRRVVQLQLMELGVSVDFDTCEKLVQQAGKAVSAPGGEPLCRNARGMIRRVTLPALSHRRATMSLRVSRAGTAIFAGGCLRWCLERVSPRGRGAVRDSGTESFDAVAIGSKVRLRHWRAGDRFRPIGMRQSVKLQDLFTNLKIPVAERRKRVVAEAESGEIFWVEGLRIGECFKVHRNTRKRLVWRWNC